MTNNYHDLYNNLKKENFNDFIDTFLSKEKVCLKLNLKDNSKMEELKIDPKETDDIIYNPSFLFQNMQSK